MQLSSILTAAIRNGVTISTDARRPNYYVLRKGENVVDFYTNDGGYVGHITYHHPDTDAMTDLFMDTYYDTIKGAMHHLNPTGELVRSTHAATPAKPVNPDDVPNEVQVSRNQEKGGIEIRFPEKPTNDIINSLKDKGFRWSPFHNVWWKKFDEADYQWAISSFVKLPVSA